jgi:ankyrin repeat protein
MAVLVKLLIAQGADVSKANTRKDTPLHIAVSLFLLTSKIDLRC